MRLTYNDIVSARLWAESYKGDDDVLDVYMHKLLSLMAEAHEKSRAFHEREIAECMRLSAELEGRFKVEPEEEF